MSHSCQHLPDGYLRKEQLDAMTPRARKLLAKSQDAVTARREKLGVAAPPIATPTAAIAERKSLEELRKQTKR